MPFKGPYDLPISFRAACSWIVVGSSLVLVLFEYGKGKHSCLYPDSRDRCSSFSTPEPPEPDVATPRAKKEKQLSFNSTFRMLSYEVKADHGGLFTLSEVYISRPTWASNRRIQGIVEDIYVYHSM